MIVWSFKIKYDKIFWILEYIIINKKKLSTGISITNNKAVIKVTSLSAHHLYIEDLSPSFTR